MAYFLTAEYSSVFKIDMFAKNKAPYVNILPSYGKKSKPPKNLSFNKKHRRSVNFYDLLIFFPYKDILPPSSIYGLTFLQAQKMKRRLFVIRTPSPLDNTRIQNPG